MVLTGNHVSVVFTWIDRSNIPASALASAVTVAVGDAVVSPLLADEVWQGLRVLGDVGRDTVVTDTGVGQSVGIAVVLLGGHGVDTGLLEADERALCPVLVAPVIWTMLDEAKLIQMTLHTPGRLVDGVGVNGVWVAHLGSVLSSDQASEGGNTEGEDGTHVDGWGGGDGGGVLAEMQRRY